MKFWQSRINRGDKIWLAEDLRGRLVGISHATTKHSDQTAEFAEIYDLKEHQDLRFFYLDDAAENTAVGQQLINQTLGDQPAITWVSGEAPAVDSNLQQAGFAPLGEPIEPTTQPWRGVPRQAMVRT